MHMLKLSDSNCSFFILSTVVKGFDMEMQLVHNAASHQVRFTAPQLHAVLRAPCDEAADGQLLVTSVFLKVRLRIAPKHCMTTK